MEPLRLLKSVYDQAIAECKDGISPALLTQGDQTLALTILRQHWAAVCYEEDNEMSALHLFFMSPPDPTAAREIEENIVVVTGDHIKLVASWMIGFRPKMPATREKGKGYRLKEGIEMVVYEKNMVGFSKISFDLLTRIHKRIMAQANAAKFRECWESDLEPGIGGQPDQN